MKTKANSIENRISKLSKKQFIRRKNSIIFGQNDFAGVLTERKSAVEGQNLDVVNAVFLFSIAVGSEMPILINTEILINLIIATLILSVFLTKVNKHNPNLESDRLTQLKD
jgi:hypothetical protein